MNLLILFSLTVLVAAQSSTSNTSPSSSSSPSPSPTSTPDASASTAAYTITALPQVSAQPACIFNCLIPIGLADPSGCDDVTNECACLSAPANVLDVLTECINTVCTDSTSAYGAMATELYESYCTSVFGSAQFAMAFTAEASAASASAAASASSSGAAISSANVSASGSGSSSSGDYVTCSLSLLTATFLIVSSFLFMIAM